MSILIQKIKNLTNQITELKITRFKLLALKAAMPSGSVSPRKQDAIDANQPKIASNLLDLDKQTYMVDEITKPPFAGGLQRAYVDVMPNGSKEMVAIVASFTIDKEGVVSVKEVTRVDDGTALKLTPATAEAMIALFKEG